MKYLLILFLGCFSMSCVAQECTCWSNYEWTKKTFEENDAGFAYALESKGEATYQQHNEAFEERLKQISDPSECAQTLYEWLTFFRSGHIGIQMLGGGQGTSDGKALTEEEIRAQFADWDRLEMDLGSFETYLANKEEMDYEGIWVSSPYKIGIKKIENEYLGFIIEADGVYWTPGQVKLRIKEQENKTEATFYMRDHSPRTFDKATLLGNTVLQMGTITLERVAPVFEPDPEVVQYFRSMEAEEPFFEQIDASTSLIRIPSFSNSEKQLIDSVISINKEIILQSENFIIDLRDNGGGSDRCYSELIPILYTNPIRTVGVEMYSTELNNQRMLDFINNPDYGFS